MMSRDEQGTRRRLPIAFPVKIRNWRQSRYLPPEKQIYKLWWIYSVEYYAPISNTQDVHIATRTNLSEKRRKQQDL